jgi:hypothetical protein
VDQISGTTPGDAPTQTHPVEEAAPANGQAEASGNAGEAAAGEGAAAQQPPEPSGFGSRGRIRRRVRFLRKARELAYRDLGGLVFNLHRFGQRNDALVLAKLNMLGQIDDELRRLEHALGEREPITVLREAGITACPRCAAIHGSEDRFCPSCGLSMGRHPDLPIAAAATPAGTAGAPGPAPTASAPATSASTAPPTPGREGAGAAGARDASTAPPTVAQPPLAPPAAATAADPLTEVHKPARATAPPVAAKPTQGSAKPPASGAEPSPGPRESPPAGASGSGGDDGDDGITEIIHPPQGP